MYPRKGADHDSADEAGLASGGGGGGSKEVGGGGGSKECADTQISPADNTAVHLAQPQRQKTRLGKLADRPLTRRVYRRAGSSAELYKVYPAHKGVHFTFIIWLENFLWSAFKTYHIGETEQATILDGFDKVDDNQVSVVEARLQGTTDLNELDDIGRDIMIALLNDHIPEITQYYNDQCRQRNRWLDIKERYSFLCPYGLDLKDLEAYYWQNIRNISFKQGEDLLQKVFAIFINKESKNRFLQVIVKRWDAIQATLNQYTANTNKERVKFRAYLMNQLYTIASPSVLDLASNEQFAEILCGIKAFYLSFKREKDLNGYKRRFIGYAKRVFTEYEAQGIVSSDISKKLNDILVQIRGSSAATLGRYMGYELAYERRYFIQHYINPQIKGCRKTLKLLAQKKQQLKNRVTKYIKKNTGQVRKGQQNIKQSLDELIVIWHDYIEQNADIQMTREKLESMIDSQLQSICSSKNCETSLKEIRKNMPQIFVKDSQIPTVTTQVTDLFKMASKAPEGTELPNVVAEPPSSSTNVGCHCAIQ